MLYDPNLWQVFGHETAIQHITQTLNTGRIRHAYLISGIPSIGKSTFARNLAMSLNCLSDDSRPCGECRPCTLIAANKHPDLSTIDSGRIGGTLKIDQIRDLQRALALRPYEAKFRVAIIKRFHEAHDAAANALLKTLEEPPANVVIILTVDDIRQLLPTILSRCLQIHLHPLRIQEIETALQTTQGASADDARLLAHLSGGRIGWAIDTWGDESHFETRAEQISLLEAILQQDRVYRFKSAEALSKDKNALLETLKSWQVFWRDVLLLIFKNEAWVTNIDREQSLRFIANQTSVDHVQEAIAATQRTLQYLAGNMNARLAVETLLLDYPLINGKLR